jgi:hypothetical protein
MGHDVPRGRDDQQSHSEADESTKARSGALVQRYLRIARWLPSYDRSWFRGDTVAALSVWALLVPQSLAYSSIAGVPVQYGLYGRQLRRRPDITRIGW